MKERFIIYGDLEYIIAKIVECKNNPENSSTAKVSKYVPSGCSMSPISSFRCIENKHDVYIEVEIVENVFWILKKTKIIKKWSY